MIASDFTLPYMKVHTSELKMVDDTWNFDDAFDILQTKRSQFHMSLTLMNFCSRVGGNLCEKDPVANRKQDDHALSKMIKCILGQERPNVKVETSELSSLGLDKGI
ncbi:hypothetical protein ElyMa_006076400 [Elysia marginata]|uniref:Uncharacterized protein n=1 Tax=Elysia marginata TaxID=1093978 RepID=A0AAV4GPH1_9GAST|nr:hypothetical protein ElyMa_006076400 [Elysia marginata]